MLVFRTLEFLFYHLLLTVVDRVSRLPRHSVPPEAMRLYRENMALKAQIGALIRELKKSSGSHPRVSLRTRAAQAFAYLITRGNLDFHDYYLSASETTLRRWVAEFRRGPWFWRQIPKSGGRPTVPQQIVDLILTFKRENPLWGSRRICDELRRMGIRISQPTVLRILRENGLDPKHDGFHGWEAFRATAKDALWALDFFTVRTAKGAYVSVLLIIDIYTRELIDLRVAPAWNADSAWTIGTLASAIKRHGRSPQGVVHDHGTQFFGRFQQQLRVLEIDQNRTPIGMPNVNCYSERTIQSIRAELLNHVRVRNTEELQWYMDEYRVYYNGFRCHQGIDGTTPIALSLEQPQAKVIPIWAAHRRHCDKGQPSTGETGGLASTDFRTGEYSSTVAAAETSNFQTPSRISAHGFMRVCGRRKLSPTYESSTSILGTKRLSGNGGPFLFL